MLTGELDRTNSTVGGDVMVRFHARAPMPPRVVFRTHFHYHFKSTEHW